MPSLANLLQHYLPVQFGGSPKRTIVANANRDAPAQQFQPVGLQDFLALQVLPRETLLPRFCRNEA